MAEPAEHVSQKWLAGLEQETEAWLREGLIGQEQAEAILLRYAVLRAREKEEGRSKLVTALAVMGALLLGVGVILFFASNWQVMPKWLKVGIVFTGFISAYAIGYYLAFEKLQYQRTGRAVIFLGTLFYGAGIWLIAQIFHISSHFPNGVLLWALGIFPIILICGSMSVLLEFSLLAVLWTLMEQFEFGSTNLYYLPVVAAALAASYWLKSRIGIGINLAGAAVWLMAANFRVLYKSGDIFSIIALLGLYGLLVLVLGRLQNGMPRLSGMVFPFKIVGILLTFISLYLLSFDFLVDDARQFLTGAGTYPVFYITALVVIVLAALAAAVFNFLNYRQSAELRETGLVVALTAVLAVLAFAGQHIDAQPLLVISNLLLFSSIAAVVIIGYLNREPVMINAGLLFFVLDVIARYFDFFWDMLPKSVFFMAGGLLLLAGGVFLERNRRKIVREMQVNDYAA